ncbi:hypothetical protein [Porcipelethomonas sp.]|uniref:hypothetical protein n=1 Tax=Porcipelethomonas sp. TaxID=2981675 RepID=UPI003EF8952B
MRKIKAFQILFCIAFVMIAIVYYIPFAIHIFTHKQTLKYNNVDYIEITIGNRINYEYESFYVDDEKALEKFTEYLASLKLVKEDDPYKHYDIDVSDKYYYFSIYSDSEFSCEDHYDTIILYGKYLDINHGDDDDCVTTDYYVMNSGYNFITGESRLSDLLVELAEDYGK